MSQESTAVNSTIEDSRATNQEFAILYAKVQETKISKVQKTKLEGESTRLFPTLDLNSGGKAGLVRKPPPLAIQKEKSMKPNDSARYRASDRRSTAKLPVTAPVVPFGVREGFHGGPDLRLEPAVNLVVVAVLVFANEENGSGKEGWKPPLLTHEHDNGRGQQSHAVVLVVASMIEAARVAFNGSMLKVKHKVAATGCDIFDKKREEKKVKALL